MKFISLLLIILLQFIFTPSRVFASHPTVDLLTTENFAVLAGSDVNDTTPSAVTGDVGLSPATGAQIDIPCSEVIGTIYDVDGAYTGGGDDACLVTDAGLLTQAKNDLTTAYNDAAGRSATTIGTQLGGETLTDGTYDSGSATFEIVAGGTLTLDGQGNPDAVFIFQMGTTLVTGSNSNVALINGAQACNVFWQVGSSATLGTGTDFVGTIMADQSITDSGGSTVNGRFLASVAAVTLNNTTISAPNCAEEDDDSTDSPGSSASPTPDLPNTGVAATENSIPWYIPVGIFVLLAFLLKLKYGLMQKN